ncbi:hypothetical protein EMIT0P43_30064 [Pseudomonas jessenii]
MKGWGLMTLNFQLSWASSFPLSCVYATDMNCFNLALKRGAEPCFLFSCISHCSRLQEPNKMQRSG